MHNLGCLLLTCTSFDERSQSYRYRIAVQVALVNVEKQSVP
ncbi:MAG TPA: hypothetical protein VIO61_06860 [Anaerolineaceae bacterium]